MTTSLEFLMSDVYSRGFQNYVPPTNYKKVEPTGTKKHPESRCKLTLDSGHSNADILPSCTTNDQQYATGT
jgi:hypothetical protein